MAQLKTTSPYTEKVGNPDTPEYWIVYLSGLHLTTGHFDEAKFEKIALLRYKYKSILSRKGLRFG